MKKDFDKLLKGKPLSNETTLFLEKHLTKKKWDEFWELANDEFKARYTKFKENDDK